MLLKNNNRNVSTPEPRRSVTTQRNAQRENVERARSSSRLESLFPLIGENSEWEIGVYTPSTPQVQDSEPVLLPLDA